jgi:regulator of protease activity HflC (stomatin/prohibitin superfamily)
MIFVLIFVIGVIISGFLLVTESDIIFKKGNFTKTIDIESDEKTDAGYVVLRQNEKTPSTLEWAEFGNKKQYLFFSVVENEVLREKIYFKIPYGIEDGWYSIDYDIVFLSGEKEERTIKFRVRA